jgi:hypothetical protein
MPPLNRSWSISLGCVTGAYEANEPIAQSPQWGDGLSSFVRLDRVVEDDSRRIVGGCIEFPPPPLLAAIDIYGQDDPTPPTRGIN